MHSVRTLMDIYPEWVAIACDAENAFNSFTRDALFDQVSEKFPSVAVFVKLVHGVTSSIVFPIDNREAGHIGCSVGCRQGGSEGSFCYALALHLILEELASAFPDYVIIAYADDVWILGPPARMLWP